MLRVAIYLLLLLLTAAAHAQPASMALVSYHSASLPDASNSTGETPTLSFEAAAITDLVTAAGAKQRATRVLGFTKARRPVAAYYFPGRSDKRALIIGGVHGTELSSIEVARQLLATLTAGAAPYYNVLVIPSLFPDNAAEALQQRSDFGSTKNVGRYSHAGAPDPNRQMPAPGSPYDPEKNVDALGRAIEYENGLLLQLIQAYKPQRVVNIHAIRDTAHGGIYADPRTDASGIALGFASDSSLAIAMAGYIEQQGGATPGNKLATAPTALYYKDPAVVAAGQWQPRSCQGSVLPGGRSRGVSLGSWASTAVSDATAAANNRAAMRLITMEFPGYKRPQDYDAAQQPLVEKQVRLYAAAILQIFLDEQYVEE